MNPSELEVRALVFEKQREGIRVRGGSPKGPEWKQREAGIQNSWWLHSACPRIVAPIWACSQHIPNVAGLHVWRLFLMISSINHHGSATFSQKVYAVFLWEDRTKRAVEANWSVFPPLPWHLTLSFRVSPVTEVAVKLLCQAWEITQGPHLRNPSKSLVCFVWTLMQLPAPVASSNEIETLVQYSVSVPYV